MAGPNVSGDLLRSIFEPALPVPVLYVVILRAMAVGSCQRHLLTSQTVQASIAA